MRSVFLIFLILLFGVGTTFAQKKRALVKLTSEASIEETRNWLDKALKDHSKNTFKTGSLLSEYSRIKDIRGKGCAIRFSVVQTRSHETKVNPPGTFSNPVPPVDLTTVYAFDFAEIDANSVSTRRSVRKGMASIVLASQDGRGSIYFLNNKGTLAETSGFKKSIRFDVKDDVADEIRNGIMRIVFLCQVKEASSSP